MSEVRGFIMDRKGYGDGVWRRGAYKALFSTEVVP